MLCCYQWQHRRRQAGRWSCGSDLPPGLLSEPVVVSRMAVLWVNSGVGLFVVCNDVFRKRNVMSSANYQLDPISNHLERESQGKVV